MTTKKELFVAVEEIIDVMGLIGEDKNLMVVDEDTTVEELTEIVKYGVDNIDPEEDEFSDTTQAIIDKFAYAMKRKKNVPIDDSTVEVVEEEEEFDEAKTVEKIYQKNVGKKKITIVEQVDENAEEEVEEEVIVKETPKPKPKAKAASQPSAGKTKFGHLLTSQAGRIDSYIIGMKKAMTIADIGTALSLPNARVSSHVNHLIKVKAVTFTVTDGKYLLK